MGVGNEALISHFMFAKGRTTAWGESAMPTEFIALTLSHA